MPHRLTSLHRDISEAMCHDINGSSYQESPADTSCLLRLSPESDMQQCSCHQMLDMQEPKVSFNPHSNVSPNPFSFNIVYQFFNFRKPSIAMTSDHSMALQNDTWDEVRNEVRTGRVFDAFY